MGSKKSLIPGSIVQYPRILKPHYRTFLERELGTFAILITIEFKYMLLCAFFNSLPNFFDIETNFPRNYNK